MHTLITPQGDAKAFKILVAAEFVGLNIDIPPFSAKNIDSTQSPLKRVPYLITDTGPLCDSYAITRYIAGQNRAAILYGARNSDEG